MEIYVNNCLSLPEQVEKNRNDISKIYQKRKKYTLFTTDWKVEGDTYVYELYNSEITEHTVVYLAINSRNHEIYKVESMRNKVLIYSDTKPNQNIDVIIYYNKFLKIN